MPNDRIENVKKARRSGQKLAQIGSVYSVFSAIKNQYTMNESQAYWEGYISSAGTEEEMAVRRTRAAERRQINRALYHCRKEQSANSPRRKKQNRDAEYIKLTLQKTAEPAKISDYATFHIEDHLPRNLPTPLFRVNAPRLETRPVPGQPGLLLTAPELLHLYTLFRQPLGTALSKQAMLNSEFNAEQTTHYKLW